MHSCREKNRAFKNICRKKSLYFADFLRNNNITMQNNCTYKKYLRKNFIFRQLVANFADFLQNNNIIMQNNCTFKKYLRENFIFRQLVAKIANFQIFNKIMHFWKKKKKKKIYRAIKKFRPWGKFIFQQLVTNFTDFRRTTCLHVYSIV